jgi:DNA-binding SARP family transcriptional activator
VLEYRLLGPLEVAGDHLVQLGGPKQRATLAILLLSANRVVSVDRLADDLYAGAAPVTALKQVQRQISDLRKALGSTSTIETRSPGYTIRLVPDQLDLTVFERLTAEALDAHEPEHAAGLLRQALGLWRGPPLADLTYEPFARAPSERLEELRLAALEQRIEAELELGRHDGLVAELEQLVAEHPLRERFHAQLMMALYRSARQAEALEAYRRARQALVAEFGIEPTQMLRQLENQILVQDPSLQPRWGCNRRLARSVDGTRAVLVAPADETGIERMLSLAGPVANLPGRELIVARVVADERELSGALSSLNEGRRALRAPARVAAFTSAEPAADLVRLATAYDVELVLVDAPSEIGATQLPSDAVTVLEQSPADVGMVTRGPVDWARGNGVFVPFGGGEHDWAALELGAWFASAANTPLQLVGARADPARGQRDASRLLANASLAVQRLVGVTGEPLLVDATADALVETVEAATLVVVGLSPRWRTEGIGAVRRSLLRARSPVVFVHGGPRPSGLAPRDARTRFSWSLGL